MIDPAFLSYLTAPLIELPLGLLGCHPPEIFRGADFNMASDLFCLGMIIYLALTNTLPYGLINQWPTKALLKGEIIPAVVVCPEISPSLARVIENLLNPNPEKRGTIGQLMNFWSGLLEQKNYLATPKMQIVNCRQQRAFSRRCWLHKMFKSILITAALLLIMIVTFVLNRATPMRPQISSPLQEVQGFYSQIAGPPQTLKNLQFNPQLGSDFYRAREKRLRSAAALLRHPLATVERLQIVSQTANCVIIAAFIKQWELNNGDWQNRPYREIIKLRRDKQHWKIINRQRIMRGN